MRYRWKDHPDARCPTHKTPLRLTQSGDQAVCVADLHCTYSVSVDGAEPTIPKPLARAMHRLRKRTRLRLAKLKRKVDSDQ